MFFQVPGTRSRVPELTDDSRLVTQLSILYILSPNLVDDFVAYKYLLTIVRGLISYAKYETRKKPKCDFS
jgi:hypothetical protein